MARKLQTAGNLLTAGLSADDNLTSFLSGFFMLNRPGDDSVLFVMVSMLLLFFLCFFVVVVFCGGRKLPRPS